MGHIRLSSRLQPAELPYCCFLRHQQLCIGVFGPGKVCRDGAQQAAGQEEADGVQQTLDMPCRKALSGFSLCVSILKTPSCSVSDHNNCTVFRACVLFHLGTRTTVVVARIVSWLDHVRWKQLGWTERRKERCYLEKHLRGGGKLTEKQEVCSRFDWKIFLSRAFRCADRRSLKKAKTGRKPMPRLILFKYYSLCHFGFDFGRSGSLWLSEAADLFIAGLRRTC